MWYAWYIIFILGSVLQAKIWKGFFAVSGPDYQGAVSDGHGGDNLLKKFKLLSSKLILTKQYLHKTRSAVLRSCQ